MFAGEVCIGFGLIELFYGSDVTWMEIIVVRDGDEWVINGEKYWNIGFYYVIYDFIFVCIFGNFGDGYGIICFIVLVDIFGFGVEEFMWTFNMLIDYVYVKFIDVWVFNDDIFGDEGCGLQIVQFFVYENRICQVVSLFGVGLYCIDVVVEYVINCIVFGKPFVSNQVIQFLLVEFFIDVEMIRVLIWKMVWEMDQGIDYFEIIDKVVMCNYWGNWFCCDVVDQVMQACGGYGYGRAYFFEYIY